MCKKLSLLMALLVLCMATRSQTILPDTTINHSQGIAEDSTIDYDALFQDFDAFMDSILTPRSYLMPGVSISKGYFNFNNKDNSLLQTTSRITYSPMLTYYHKSGWGLNATGYMVNDDKNLNLYQIAISPTYDYLKDKRIATGFAYTRYFEKKSLPFYTSPLRNEVYGYFTYRKWWFRPMVALSYGWGSRSAYESKETQITSLRLRPRGYTYINTTESVYDFSVLASVRHDFYWLDVFANNDHIRFTPQLNFTSGTQKFGFNQTSNTYGQTNRNGSGVLYNTENYYLDDKINFQPLSLAMYLRGEYSIGKFFIQPQFSVDYYFPATSKNWSTFFSVNMGLVF